MSAAANLPMDEAGALYPEGASLPKLADRYQVAIATVRGRLLDAEVPLRRRGAPRKQIDLNTVVYEAHRAGSARRAASLGVSRSTVRRRLAEIHGDGQPCR